MATYNITKSDGTAGPAIPDAASPDTQTDLQLVGQNAVSYGLDVAQSFYFLLENFAKDTAPAIGGVTGQLWYDKGGVSTTPALNYWSGSIWKPMASTVVGVSADSMSRWDNIAKAWTEQTQLTLSATGVLTILDSGLTDSVAFSHDGIDFNVVGTLTADINVTGVTAVNMPSITLVTPLADEQGGTGTNTYATGDILFASGVNTLVKLTAGANGELLTLAAGVPTWAAAGSSVSALDDLTDVTITAPDVNSILHNAAGQYIDSVAANFGWDGSNLVASNVNSIAAANLIDRSAPGTISGVATFTNNIAMSTGNITLLDNDKIIFGTGSDIVVDFDNATNSFQIAGFGTAVDLIVTDFSGALRVDTAIFSGITGSGGGEMKVLGTTNSNSTNVGFVSVNHNDDGQQQIRMGTRSGSSFSEVNAIVDDLNLYAANTLVFNIDPTQTTITEGGVTAMNWHAVSGTNTTSSAGVFDDGGAERNVGYNETPEVIVSSAVTVDSNDIGKFLRRSALTSRVITLSADTNIPTGGSFMAHNDHTTGTLTVATTQTLEWVDGSGIAPLTGTRTIAYNGVVTIRKKSSTVWQIWGNGIS